MSKSHIALNKEEQLQILNRIVEGVNSGDIILHNLKQRPKKDITWKFDFTIVIQKELNELKKYVTVV